MEKRNEHCCTFVPCAGAAVGTDNFVEEVHGGFQCEVQKPYVLYRNRINEVQRAGWG
jgi:hypothetical protein